MPAMVTGNEIVLSGTVGDLYWGESFTSSDVIVALAQVGRGQDVVIRINSGGGIATEGAAIHAALARTPARRPSSSRASPRLGFGDRHGRRRDRHGYGRPDDDSRPFGLHVRYGRGPRASGEGAHRPRHSDGRDLRRALRQDRRRCPRRHAGRAVDVARRGGRRRLRRSDPDPCRRDLRSWRSRDHRRGPRADGLRLPPLPASAGAPRRPGRSARLDEPGARHRRGAPPPLPRHQEQSMPNDQAGNGPAPTASTGNVVDLDTARAEGRSAALAYVREVRDLCAGWPARHGRRLHRARGRARRRPQGAARRPRVGRCRPGRDHLDAARRRRGARGGARADDSKTMLSSMERELARSGHLQKGA